MTFSGPVINQSACGIYLSHIINIDIVKNSYYSLLVNDIKLEKVVLLQSQYEISNTNQYNHFRDFHSHTCQSRTPHVRDL